MAKWILAIIFLTAFPFTVFGQDRTQDKAVQTWINEKFGIQLPDPEIRHSWSNMPMVIGCDYEWSIRWNDARFEIKDGNENHYRVSYKNDTLTVDFTREFNGFFGG